MKHLVAMSLFLVGSSLAATHSMASGQSDTASNELDRNPPIQDDNRMVRLGVGAAIIEDLEYEYTDGTNQTGSGNIQSSGDWAFLLSYSFHLAGPLFWDIEGTNYNFDVDEESYSDAGVSVDTEVDIDEGGVFWGLSTGPSVHFFRDRLFSPYLGVGVGYSYVKLPMAGDDDATDVKPFASGKVGLDVKVLRRFYLGAEYRYTLIPLNERDFSSMHQGFEPDDLEMAGVFITGRGTF